MYRFTWKGRAPSEFTHIALGIIIGYLVAIAMAPYVGQTVIFNLATCLSSVVIGIGFAWILDSLGFAKMMPGKSEYIVYCGLGIAVYNAIVTAGLLPLSPVDLFGQLIPKDPMAVVRGFVYGGIGGAIITLAEGIRFHGRPIGKSKESEGLSKRGVAG